MRYLTPAFFAATQSGLASFMTSLGTRETAALLARAEQRVDRFCRVPGFQPLTQTNESHEWNSRSRRFYFDSWPNPCTAVTALSMQIGTDNNALDLTELYINNDEGFIEITELASLVGPALVIWGLGLAEILATYTASYIFAYTGDTLTNEGDNLTYAANRPLWDAGATTNVYKNGALLASGYTVNAQEGTVTFTAANLATDVVTVDYTTHIPDAVRDATVLVLADLVAERFLQSQGLGGLTMARNGRMYELQRPTGKNGPQMPQEAQDILVEGGFINTHLFGA